MIVRKFRTREARRKERVRLIILVSGICVGVGVLISILVYVAHRREFRVNEIHVQTDGVLQTTDVVQVVTERLQGSVLGVVPKNLAPMVRINTLAEDVRSVFPRAQEVIVRRINLTALSINIVERTPDTLWCGDIIPPVAYEPVTQEARAQHELWGDCYLVDASGYMYAHAPLFSGDVFPRFYAPLEGTNPIGQQLLARDEYVRLRALYDDVRNDGYPVQALLVVDEHDIELYLEIGLRVVLPRVDTALRTRERLHALLESNIIDMSREPEYADLRFGNKVFIRYPNSELSNQTASLTNKIAPNANSAPSFVE